MRKYLFIPFLIASVLAMIYSTIISFPKESKALTSGVSLTATILTYITTAVDYAAVTFGTITPTTPAYASSTVTSATNNSTGYNIKTARDDADTTLDLTTDAAVNITDQAAWLPGTNKTTAGNATTTALLDNSGYVLASRVDGGSSSACGYSSSWWGSTSTKLWAGFNSTTKTTFDCDSYQISSTYALHAMRLNVDNTQKTGDYSGGITYTVTANP